MGINYQLFDTLLDAVFVINGSQEILYANQAASILSDIPLMRIKVGSPLSGVMRFDPELFQTPDELPSIVSATLYREVSYSAAKGKSGTVQVSAQPSQPGEWILYIRDMTLEESLQKKYRKELALKEEAIVDLQIANEKLKDYSVNLEQKVEVRTKELAEANRSLNAMLDSVGQGFILFDLEGMCSPVHSKACLSLLEQNPSHQPIWKILKVSVENLTPFRDWYQSLVQEKLPFEDLISLGPVTYAHSAGKRIDLQYFSVRDASSRVSGVVMVATDRTSEYEARAEAQRERSYAKMVITLSKNRDRFWQFVRNSKRMLDHVEKDLKNFDIDQTMRVAHTIKGDASIYHLTTLVSAAHSLEDFLEKQHSVKVEPGFVIEVRKWIANLRHELQNILVTHKDLLGDFLSDSERRVQISYASLMNHWQKLKSVPGLDRLSAEFEESFIKEPIGCFFSHFDDVIADLAAKRSKEVLPLIIEDGGLRVIGERYAGLFSSFIHFIRNAIDHGIEPPEVRLKNNKKKAGQISIICTQFQKNGTPWLSIVFKDDGDGIDPEKVRGKLKEKNLLNTNESDGEVIQHIFDPSFSTSETVDDLSGRGVGTGAVLQAAKDLGGSVTVQSHLGKGTTFTVSVPVQVGGSFMVSFVN